MARFFHRLKVSQKLMLISFLFMIPDSVLLCLFVVSINDNIRFAQFERFGNEYQAPLEELLRLLPDHFFQLRPGAGSDRENIEARIDAAIDKLERIDARIGPTLQFTQEGLAKRKREHCTVQNLKSEWEKLKREVEPDGMGAEPHRHLIADIRTMITHAGDSSNLILDPDLDSYYLMDVTLLALPDIQDRLWNVAAYGNTLPQRSSFSNSECNALAVQAALLKEAGLDRIALSAQTALNEDRNFYGVSERLQERLPPALDGFKKAAEEFIGLTARLSENEVTGISREDYLAAGRRAHAESFALWKVSKEELDGLLEKRIHYYRVRRAKSLILTALALMAAAGFVTFITRSISGPLQRQTAELRRSNLALTQEISERQRVELALRSAEEKYRSIFENSVEGIFQTTFDGKYLVANPTLARIYGYEHPVELQDSVTDIASRLYADPARRAEFQRQIAERGEIHQFESEIFHRDGSKRWISENARAVYSEKGALLYYEGTVEDITERKQSEAALEKAQKELLDASRLAGKAEVATGILHNVGNVLNSVNVSANYIADTLRKSKIANLAKVSGLLKENSSSLAAYITADPKGRQLPGYLGDLSTHLAAEHESLATKMDQLRRHLEHVKEIIAMQQNYAKVGGIQENVKVSDLVEDAIRLNSTGFSRHDIEVIREFDASPEAILDKHKVLQILVNLFRNAEHACAMSGRPGKQLVVQVANGNGRVKISVRDNGIGIPAENMLRIFSHGFTTRKDGHGFGLHSCALAARELGGGLKAHSDGTGLGATFVLDLPLQPQDFTYGRTT